LSSQKTYNYTKDEEKEDLDEGKIEWWYNLSGRFSVAVSHRSMSTTHSTSSLSLSNLQCSSIMAKKKKSVPIVATANDGAIIGEVDSSESDNMRRNGSYDDNQGRSDDSSCSFHE